MQFHVPQYIDIEDKVFEKFSLGQVIYLAGGAGASYMLMVKIFFPLNLLLTGVIMLFALALAFFPKQKFGKPFLEIVEAAFNYLIRVKLYTWKRIPKKRKATNTIPKDVLLGGNITLPNIGNSKLKDMSWNIDVGTNEVDTM